MKHLVRATAYLSALLLMGLPYAIGQQDDSIRGGDVAFILDGSYALTAAGYAEYRKCIAGVPLGTAIDVYTTDLETCKDKAKSKAYRIQDTADESQKDSYQRGDWASQRLSKY